MPPIHVMLNGSLAESVVNFRGSLVKELVASGHRVTAVVPDISPDLARAIRNLGAEPCEVPLQRGGTSAAADLKYAVALRRTINNIRPDLVLNYTIKPNIWGSLMAASLRVRSASMVTGLGYTFIQRTSIKERVVGAISRLLYASATRANDVVIFQNRDDMKDFIAAGCLKDTAKARLMNGSGVDTSYFAPTPLPEKPVFLMIARLLKAKGVREYAEAASAVLAKRPECRFLLAGDLDDTPDSVSREELEQWKAVGIEHLGWISDVRGAISEASVYVLPSYREGTPRTVLEASSMGRCSIVTDAPGCRETVVDGETGLMVPVRDSAALALAMEKVASSSQFREQAGQAARRYCLGKFAVEKVNRQLLDHLGL